MSRIVKPYSWGPIRAPLVDPAFQWVYERNPLVILPMFNGALLDVLSGATLTPNGSPTQISTLYGAAWRYDGASWHAGTPGRFAALTNEITLAIFTKWTAASSDSYGKLAGNLSGTTNRHLLFRNALTTDLRFVVSATSPTFLDAVGALADGEYRLYVARYRASHTWDVFAVNPSGQITAEASGTPPTGNLTAVDTFCVSGLASTNALVQDVVAVWQWGALIPRELLQSLARDPVGPFRMDRRILVAVPAGGGSVEAAPGLCEIAVTGYAPTVSVTAHVTVTPGVSEEAVTGYAPTVTASDHQTVTPGVAETTITGYAPTVTVTAHVTATPGVSALTLTGYAPTVSTTGHVSVTPGVSQTTITGYAPIVSATGAVTTTPGVSQTTLTGFAPTVSVTAHVTATPGVSALSITGYAPTITTTENVSVTPGVAEVAFTGLAPTVTTSAHITATPGMAQIVFTGYAPVVTAVGNNVTVAPGVSALSITGYAPTVTSLPGPYERITVPADDRSLAVVADSRSIVVPNDDRSIAV